MKTTTCLTAISLVILLSVLAPFAHASEDIDHPIFQTEEYKKYIEDQKVRNAEVESLQRQLVTLREERNSYGPAASAVLGIVRFLPAYLGINMFIIVSLLSVVLVLLYLYYIKKFNSAKWFILFKTKGNIGLLLKSMKQFNKLLLFGIVVLSCPGVCHAGSTTLLTDVKYVIFGNEIERGYVLTKYPNKINSLSYSRAKDIFVYQRFEESSFEQTYNFLVHKHVLGIGIDAPDLLRLIEKCRTIENLGTTYAFIFALDDAYLREVVPNRLKSLIDLKTSVDFKLLETSLIIDLAAEKNKTDMLKGDIAGLLKQEIVEVSETDTVNILKLSMLWMDFDSNKSLKLWEKVRYRFEDIFRLERNKDEFRKLFIALNQKNDVAAIYSMEDLESKAQGYSDKVKISLASFFDSLSEEVARSLVKPMRVDKVTIADRDRWEMDQLVYLVHKYRPADAEVLYKHLVQQFSSGPGGLLSILNLANWTSGLGFSREQTVEDVIQKDSELYPSKDDRSNLVNQEFMRFLTDAEIEKNMEYLKKRPHQCRVILEALIDRRYDLFLEYLDYMHEKYASRIADFQFENKLVRFDKWRDYISSGTLGNYSTLPYTYFLAAQELATPAPDYGKVMSLMESRVTQLLQNVIRSDRKLHENDWVQSLILYHLFNKASDPQMKEIAAVLEETIRLQLPDRMNQQRDTLNATIQSLRSSISSLSAELTSMKSAKAGAYFRFYSALLLAVALGIYSLAALVYSIKYSINAVLSYSGTRIALFFLIFMETLAKFLLPVLYFTAQSIFIIVVVQLYGFLRGKDSEYPNTERSLAYYRETSKN